jgi:hypothetical protein
MVRKSCQHVEEENFMSIDPVFARNPKEAKRLGRKHIAVVGLGSVGSALALMGARAGVSRFTLVDPDVLALENIGRHMLTRDSVGRPKVEAVKRAIEDINPSAQVRALAKDFLQLNSKNLCKGRLPDLLIATIDSFRCQSLVNSLSLEKRIPAVYVGCWGEASVGEILYVLPGKTPCFECYAGFRRNTAPLPARDPRRYTDPKFDDTKLPAQAGLWPNILIICGVAFQVILALLDSKSAQAKNLVDRERTLFLVNVSDYSSPLQRLAVSFGRVKKGCAICDESKLAELGKNLLLQEAPARND